MSDINQGESVTFAPGEIIVQQGDRGGDLFFLKNGTVEIFVTKDHEEIKLGEMHGGEVLGLMSCLHRTERMASARAISEVEATKISAQKFEKAVEAFPAWMKAIIKEFTVRLGEMNTRFADQNIEVKRLRKTQYSFLQKGTLIADSIGVVGESVAVRMDDVRVVPTKRLISAIAENLGMNEEEVGFIYERFKRGGLIWEQLHLDTKDRIVKLDDLKKMKWFSQFSRDSNAKSAVKKLFSVKVPQRGRRMLSALIDYAKVKGMPLDKTVTFDCKDLQKEFQKVTSQEFNMETIDAVDGKGFLNCTGGEGKPHLVSFIPSELSRLLAGISTVRLLLEADHVKDDPRLQKSA